MDTANPGRHRATGYSGHIARIDPGNHELDASERYIDGKIGHLRRTGFLAAIDFNLRNPFRRSLGHCPNQLAVVNFVYRIVFQVAYALSL